MTFRHRCPKPCPNVGGFIKRRFPIRDGAMPYLAPTCAATGVLLEELGREYTAPGLTPVYFDSRFRRVQ